MAGIRIPEEDRMARQAQVARMRASGASIQTMARALGISDKTIYKDLRDVRERAMDKIELDPEAEAEFIANEFEKLDSMAATLRRNIEEFTEPGTKAYASNVVAWLSVIKEKTRLATELGILRRAPLRHLVTDTDDLANMEGEELDKYVADLDRAVAVMFRAGKRASTDKKRK